MPANAYIQLQPEILCCAIRSCLIGGATTQARIVQIPYTRDNGDAHSHVTVKSQPQLRGETL